MADELENRIRRAVRVRLKRGDRDAVAKAAGHPTGSWVSNWLAGAQKHATIDEMAAMLKALETSLAAVVGAPDASDLDWQVFGAVRQLKTLQQKQDALDLVRGLADDAVLVVSQRPTGTKGLHRKLATGGRRR